jgi:hypothetical protein
MTQGTMSNNWGSSSCPGSNRPATPASVGNALPRHDTLLQLLGAKLEPVGILWRKMVEICQRPAFGTPEVTALAMGAALAFAAIDRWYGLSGRIAPI